jgi:hypothetical protein
MEKKERSDQGRRITHLPISRSLKLRISTEDGEDDDLSKCGGLVGGKVGN